MNKIYNTLFVAVIATVMLCTSCTKDFDEINTNPDKATEEQVPVTNVLAFCESATFETLFDQWISLRDLGPFSGQIAQWQYSEESYYVPRQSTDANAWSNIYCIISNVRTIEERSTPNSNMWAAATVFECQLFQMACDTWGDIPYSEACVISKPNKKPAYDKQSFIYLDLLKRLKTATETFDDNSEGLGKGDLLLNNNIDYWRRYANALRIRIAARIAKIDPTTSAAVVNEILGDPAKYPLPETSSHNIFYFADGNSVYEEWASLYNKRPGEVGISKALANALKELNDPRLPVYAEPTQDYLNGKSSEKYAGHQHGLRTNANITSVSSIGERFCHKKDFGGFVPLLRSCETYFALAYMKHLGIETTGYSEQSAYEKALRLSLEENNIADTAITRFLTNEGAFDGSEEKLATQWWISVFKNSYEAWSIYRMTGHPTSNIMAPGSVYSNHNTQPLVYPYPVTEENLNTANQRKANEKTVDLFWGRQMWWDTRTDVY